MKNNETFSNNVDINFDEYTHSPEVEEKEERKNIKEMQKVVEQFPHAFKKVESELEDSDKYYILRDSGDKSGSTDGDILLSKHGVTIVEGITRIKDGDKKETIETFPFEASDFGDYTLQNIGLNSGKLENSITGEVKYVGHEGDEFTHFGGETYNIKYHQYDFDSDSFSGESKQRFIEEIDKVEQQFRDTDFAAEQQSNL